MLKLGLHLLNSKMDCSYLAEIKFTLDKQSENYELNCSSLTVKWTLWRKYVHWNVPKIISSNCSFF